MAKPAAVSADRDVRDDVDLLARSAKRTLESRAVRRRHDQLLRHAARAKHRRQRGEELVNGCRLLLTRHELAQLVVERPVATKRGGVLGHARQLRWMAARVVEALG